MSPNLTVPAKVNRVVDGDTVDLELTMNIRVRLSDCWAAEIREDKGLEAKMAMSSMLPEGSRCLLFVDLEEVDSVSDVMTFGRIVGKVFVDGVGDVGEALIDSGLAERTKK